MKFLNNSVLYGALFIANMLSFSVYAGQDCTPKKADVLIVARAFKHAQELQQKLEATGENVVLIARRGKAPDEYNVKFSHVGYAVNEGKGIWRVYHSLNTCSGSKANLYSQGIVQFYADDLFNYQTAVVIPKAEIQQRLYSILHSDNDRAITFSSEYSIIANPFATRYQNSNGWVLETFMSAISPTPLSGREQAQAMLQQLGYQPTTLKVSKLAKVGGRMFAGNVFFDDHPKNGGEYLANTGDSLMSFFSNYAKPRLDCFHFDLGAGVCVW